MDSIWRTEAIRPSAIFPESTWKRPSEMACLICATRALSTAGVLAMPADTSCRRADSGDNANPEVSADEADELDVSGEALAAPFRRVLGWPPSGLTELSIFTMRSFARK